MFAAGGRCFGTASKFVVALRPYRHIEDAPLHPAVAGSGGVGWALLAGYRSAAPLSA